MKKIALILMVIAGVVLSQSLFAQDTTAVKKKVSKVVKVKKEITKASKEKKECADKKACC